MILAIPDVMVKYAKVETELGIFFTKIYEDAQQRVIENKTILDSVLVISILLSRCKIHMSHPLFPRGLIPG